MFRHLHELCHLIQIYLYLFKISLVKSAKGSWALKETLLKSSLVVMFILFIFIQVSVIILLPKTFAKKTMLTWDFISSAQLIKIEALLRILH